MCIDAKSLSGYILSLFLLSQAVLPISVFAVPPFVDNNFKAAPTVTKQRQVETDTTRTAFQDMKVISSVPIVVPAVVEVPFAAGEVLQRTFMVRALGSGALVPWYFKESVSVTDTPLTATNAYGNGQYLVDKNEGTYVAFELPQDREGSAEVTLTSAEPVAASALYIGLAENVAAPIAVDVFAREGASPEKILVSNGTLSGRRIAFPHTQADTWRVVFRYIQPLRITEMRLMEDAPQKSVQSGLRFLAQPGESYEILYNPDPGVRVSVPVGESGDLVSTEGVKVLAYSAGSKNGGYVPADVDGDGISDVADNCVTTPNADQRDVDGNKRGDECDDFDKDGVLNAHDNCIAAPNRMQEDRDGDGVGNVCDPEESRFTERHKWVAWAGISIAAVVLLGLFVIVARRPKEEVIENTTEIA